MYKLRISKNTKKKGWRGKKTDYCFLSRPTWCQCFLPRGNPYETIATESATHCPLTDVLNWCVQCDWSPSGAIRKATVSGRDLWINELINCWRNYLTGAITKSHFWETTYWSSYWGHDWYSGKPLCYTITVSDHTLCPPTFSLNLATLGIMGNRQQYLAGSSKTTEICIVGFRAKVLISRGIFNWQMHFGASERLVDDG